MNILEFATQSPWLTFFIVVVLVQGLASIIDSICNRSKCECCNSKEIKNG